MVVDLSNLKPGRSLLDERIVITAAASEAYRSAVGDDTALYADEGLVPPMAVAALVMGAAMRAVELPAGAVHTGQELEFAAPVSEGAELECSAKVVQNSVRRGTRFLVIEITGEHGDELAVAGRVTLAVTEADSGDDAR